MKFVPRRLVRTADVSRGRWTRRELVLGGVSAVAVLAGIFLVLTVSGEILARLLPDSWERRLGGWTGAVPALAADGGGEGLRRAESVLARLSDGSTFRDLDYRVVILASDLPNAVALPGGAIGLTRGLLDRVGTDTGLAFVIAHELGHHQERHLLRKLGRGLVFLVLKSLISDGVVSASVDLGLGLAESGYSRAQERVADEFALRLVASKYEELSGALEFFEVVREEQEEYVLQKYAGSHPLTRERIETLEALRDRLAAERAR